jgi:hypothetical protein
MWHSGVRYQLNSAHVLDTKRFFDSSICQCAIPCRCATSSAGTGGLVINIHVIVGAAVAILAAIELWMMSLIPPRLTAGR